MCRTSRGNYDVVTMTTRRDLQLHYRALLKKTPYRGKQMRSETGCCGDEERQSGSRRCNQKGMKEGEEEKKAVKEEEEAEEEEREDSRKRQG